MCESSLTGVLMRLRCSKRDGELGPFHAEGQYLDTGDNDSTGESVSGVARVGDAELDYQHIVSCKRARTRYSERTASSVREGI